MKSWLNPFSFWYVILIFHINFRGQFCLFKARFSTQLRGQESLPSAGKYWSTVLPTGGFCRWGDIPVSLVSVIAYFWHELHQLEYLFSGSFCLQVRIEMKLLLRTYSKSGSTGKHFILFKFFLVLLSTLDALFSVILSVFTRQRRTLQTEDTNAENVNRDF